MTQKELNELLEQVEEEFRIFERTSANNSRKMMKFLQEAVKNNGVLPLISFSEERAEVCEIDDCNLRPYGDLKVCKHHFLEQIDKQT